MIALRLWAAWAYFAMMAVIVLELHFIGYTVLFIIPHFRKLMNDGVVDAQLLGQMSTVPWAPAFLTNVSTITESYGLWIVLLFAVGLGLFEWRVKSASKPFIRMALLATAAVGLLVVVMLMAGSIMLCYSIGTVRAGGMARPFVVEKVRRVEKGVSDIEEALARNDWKTLSEKAAQASQDLQWLTVRLSVVSLARYKDGPSHETVESQVATARQSMARIVEAADSSDSGRLESALRDFRKSFAPLLEAANHPGPYP